MLNAFKAYDIRGRLGVDLDASIARRIGRGFARALGARRVVLGRDIRASSAELAGAVTQALVDEGVEVLDLGLAGLQGLSHAGDGATGANASHDNIDRAVRVTPDLFGRGLAMNFGIGRILKLLRDKGLRNFKC